VTSEESLSECSDSISSDNFSIYKGSSSLDLMQTSPETVISAGKAYLKIDLLVETLLHEFMADGRSGIYHMMKISFVYSPSLQSVE